MGLARSLRGAAASTLRKLHGNRRREDMNDAATTVAPASPGSNGPDMQDLEARIVEALKTVYDPEIPVDVYELGLIYDVRIGEDARVKLQMTLTSPHCPVAESLPGDVERTVRDVEGVEGAEVEVVWDPTWNPAMMSEAAKLELGFF